VLPRIGNSDIPRPSLILGAVLVVILAVAVLTRTAVDGRLVFSILQYFATLAPVALGLGLTMIVREYDLSVGSILGLAGCVAVIAGAGNPYLGLACGVGVGLFVGLVQGVLIVGLRISSIPVTLGGLMTVGALSYVITGNQTIAYPDLDVAMAVNAPIFGILSVRSAIAVTCCLAAGFVITYTRIGRDLSASGSDRRAAATAGVRTDIVLILVFMTSGGLSALSGVLLSYSLAAASPVGLTDILVPATAASIIGGVSLSGGRGHPVGIAAGVLTLCVLSAGLNAFGASPFVQNVAIGGVLLVVAISDAPLLLRRLRFGRRSRAPTLP
jgi:ribose/xylose/arabinose/galactoside ABC-type transport system permease subunit